MVRANASTSKSTTTKVATPDVVKTPDEAEETAAGTTEAEAPTTPDDGTGAAGPDDAETEADDKSAPPAAAPNPPAPPAQPNTAPPAPVGEQPCDICFPTGWTDGSTSVGCEHGQWARETS